MKPTARRRARCLLLLASLWTASAFAKTRRAAAKLGIVVMDGEGAINDPKQKTTMTVIQVQDENQNLWRARPWSFSTQSGPENILRRHRFLTVTTAGWQSLHPGITL